MTDVASQAACPLPVPGAIEDSYTPEASAKPTPSVRKLKTMLTCPDCGNVFPQVTKCPVCAGCGWSPCL